MAADIVFEQNGIFWPMVGSFMVAVSGSISITDPKNVMALTKEAYVAMPGIVTSGHHFIPLDVHKLVVAGNISAGAFVRSMCGMLANTAYETVKDRKDGSPEFEFFRHVRNASSHGNTFNFDGKRDEPRHPAHWRSARIDSHAQGQRQPALRQAVLL